MRCFPAIGYGLYEVSDNVWECTTNWFMAQHAPADPDKPSCCAVTDPRGPAREASLDPLQPQVDIPRRVVKGGSFLCAPNYCRRYRPAARHAQIVESGMSHIGFRCICRDPTKSLSEKSAEAVPDGRISRPSCRDVRNFVRFMVMIGLPRRENNTAFAQPPTFGSGS